MKKLFLTVAACAAMTFSASAVEPGNANIYASGLKVSEDGNSIQFVANAPGSATIKFYKAGEQVWQIESIEVVKGVNVVDFAYKLPETVKAGDELTWDVTLSAEAKTAWVGFSAMAAGLSEIPANPKITCLE